MKEIYVCPFHGMTKIHGAELGPSEVVRHLMFYYPDIYRFNVISQEPVDTGRTVKSAFLDRVYSRKVTLILGGDHSTTAFIFDNLLESSMYVSNIIFDAHNDNTDIYYDGYYNWNVIAHVSKHIKKGLVIGYRDARESMPLNKNYVYYDDRVEQNDLKKQIIGFCKTNHYIYVSIDLDVINPIEFPGTGYPCAGGIWVRELIDYISCIIDNADHIIFDLVEFNPIVEKETSLMVIDRIIRLVSTFL